ncbi:SSI family serine proteinase inhibitor [Streptomyces aidingensis]|uniref:Subtilisin inhibitor-like n=1 Tax=Streptomyces aidingensis TaxID=910347 RepID=A0A1I1QCN2_9ACTN|nr:SSI family serine proteinase inhibitor [Streptomyces aidingensis]SFD19876.1 Subtilisin inhibitor-like [Streptomyces aidingensis]
MPVVSHTVLAALTLAAAAVAPASAAPSGGPGDDTGPGARLTVSVLDGQSRGAAESHLLECHPAGGDHPEARAACDALDEATATGDDPFAPVPEDAICTQIYGGPWRAEVRGEWNGRQIEAEFSRANGCEIARWDRLIPALPDVNAVADQEENRDGGTSGNSGDGGDGHSPAVPERQEREEGRESDRHRGLWRFAEPVGGAPGVMR